jgi:hypothetical protein
MKLYFTDLRGKIDIELGNNIGETEEIFAIFTMIAEMRGWLD